MGIGLTPLYRKNITVPKPEQQYAGRNFLRRHSKYIKDMRVGTWNVLSLHRPGALKVLLEQLDLYKLDLLALQEVRWIGNGILEKKSHTIFYSCHKKGHAFGTGFVLHKRIKHLIMDFKAKSPRSCILRIKGCFFNYSFICVHAPTNEKNEEEKERFYDELDKIYDECPKRDIKIILGDLNTQIGKEGMYKPTIGTNSLHTVSNDNGIRLINFASSRSMVIASTVFLHKDIHKRTWKSPDGKTFNQIDHVVIDTRHFFKFY
ncbi:hypothetical protein L9F63_017608 [Diploptera punctata]|uniref:Endonuclease/exonuclease/phosphatase domain-containing protein n=1 Tax=Diploptera punctata TaxID=6984 RepID=A0AAD7ZYH6_DIPPU|nr:hypothetical protein L9F63_017608 [Diploptera punctata]